MKSISLVSFLLLSSALAGGAGQPTERIVYTPATGTLPFSEVVKVGNTLYLSGQIGTDASGKLVAGGIKAQTRQVLSNIEDVLKKQGYSRANLVKCVVMLRDIGDFAAMNEVYSGWMAKPYPARSTLGGVKLAMNAEVEIECIAAR